MAVIQVVNLTELTFDEYTREYILPNDGYLSEETFARRWENNHINGKSELFLDNLPSEEKC